MLLSGHREDIERFVTELPPMEPCTEPPPMGPLWTPYGAPMDPCTERVQGQRGARKGPEGVQSGSRGGPEGVQRGSRGGPGVAASDSDSDYAVSDESAEGDDVDDEGDGASESD